MPEITKTVVQCDFDGTVTEEDVSFILLDAFAGGDWRQINRDYEGGKITVGRFNSDAFAMVKADRETLLKVVSEEAKIRAGFQEFVASCRRKGFRFVIVSNGLDFYIEAILKDIGLGDIEFHAARTRFNPEGLEVQYIGPDGNPLDNDFKKAYINSFLHEGYRIIYIGDGSSDFAPAKQSHYVFATGRLSARCQQTNLDCTPFTDFNDIVKILESL